MTDKEIEKQAEEYTEENGEKYNAHLSSKRMIYLSFKDGAKWGMEHAIEWHDLRKTPDDLPKKKGEYWTKYNDCNDEKGGYYDSHYYDPDNSSYKLKWYKLDVIAWCELPQFKE